MSAERFNQEYSNSELLISAGIPFKPFENSTAFHELNASDFEPQHQINESDQHALVLRRHVNFLQMHGHIDILSESKMMSVVPLFLYGRGALNVLDELTEEPLGSTDPPGVKIDTQNKSTEQDPCVLRFSFNLNTPSDLARLLRTYVHVDLGTEEYVMFWENQRKTLQRVFKSLENREENDLKISEMNLFNIKWLEKKGIFEETDIELDPEEQDNQPENLGRVTFVYLPKDLEKLRTIKVTFRNLDDPENGEITSPIEPESIKEPVHV